MTGTDRTARLAQLVGLAHQQAASATTITDRREARLQLLDAAMILQLAAVELEQELTGRVPDRWPLSRL